MDTLSINISWEWALGIIITISGSLIMIAWNTGSRFTALETSMEWVKGILKEVKLASDNAATPAFAAHSPINLNALGDKFLNESGLKNYIDTNKDFLLNQCRDHGVENPYEVQQHAFKLMDGYKFDEAFYQNLQKFAFEKGTTIDVLRRVGGIYLRNVCLDSLGMNRADIDKHTPTATP